MSDYTRTQYLDTYIRLREIAARGQTISYQKLSDLVGLGMDMQGVPDDRRRLGALLGAISTAEYAGGRPLLSAVVLLAGSDPMNPGPGFFKLARSIGKMGATESESAFFVRELLAVHTFWKI